MLPSNSSSDDILSVKLSSSSTGTPSSGKEFIIVLATPCSSIARLTDGTLLNLAEAEDRLVESRICLIGDDRPWRIDLELMDESIEMLSRFEKLLLAFSCRPEYVALRASAGRMLLPGDRALRTDFMTKSSLERLAVRDFLLPLASSSFSRFDSCIW